jgi:hypothetical protein
MLLPNPNIEEIEAAIAALDASDDAALQVWTRSQGITAFCAEVALLQYVITWARKRDGKSEAHFAELSSDSPDFEGSLQNALGAPHVISAWVLANRLTDSRDLPLKRVEAKGYGRYLDAMDTYEFPSTHTSAESRANLVCVQGGQREFIRPLYVEEKGTWKVKPEGEIRAMILDILAQFTSTWPVKYLREVCEPLSHLTRELVENSDWWARMDEKGSLYSKGIRAILFRLIDVDDDTVISYAGANDHLKSYLAHCLINDEHSKTAAPSTRPTPIQSLSFIELSIVDSGPGLARRWLAGRPNNKKQIDDINKLSIEEEEEALIECFKKWRTTSGNTLRGVGLFSVARLLRRRNGFMRLRTGRLGFLFGTQSAIVDIERRVSKELHGKKATDYVKLRDGTHVFLDSGKMIFFLRPWSEDRLAPVEGTSYSILLPV